MKILVLVKHVPDATGERSFADDHTVDRDGADGLLSELDEYAVEQALRIADEREDVEVVALTLGPDDAADAIKRTGDGVVQSARKPRCIACNNCVLACPFGVPKYVADFDQMMKCDMCTDRTSEGYAPMCASVCPSEALWYGTPEEFRATRSGSIVDNWLFGRQSVHTKVFTVVDDLGAIDALDGTTGTWLDDPFELEG